jgi:polyferredoxin
MTNCWAGGVERLASLFFVHEPQKSLVFPLVFIILFIFFILFFKLWCTSTVPSGLYNLLQFKRSRRGGKRPQ